MDDYITITAVALPCVALGLFVLCAIFGFVCNLDEHLENFDDE